MPRTWTTKDGQKINVRDLGDDHLWNILRYAARKLRAALRAEEAAYWAFGSMLHGEMATLAWEQCEEEVCNPDLVEIMMSCKPLRGVLIEARRRRFNWESKVDSWT